MGLHLQQASELRTGGVLTCHPGLVVTLLGRAGPELGGLKLTRRRLLRRWERQGEGRHSW